MIAKQIFEELTTKISSVLADSPAKDMEKNLKAMLGSALAKMDLVTREEFDIQQQILLKTRSKLNDTEARLAALEALIADKFPVENQTNQDNMAEPAALSDGVKSQDGGESE